MSADGVVLRTTLLADVAVQASALAQSVTKVARTVVRELSLVNFGAPAVEAAPPSRKEPGWRVYQKSCNAGHSAGHIMCRLAPSPIVRS